MTSSIKSDIRFELLVAVLVYRPNFGLIETTLKIGPTGNPPLPVNRSEIQKTKSTARRGIKFSICQNIVLWGFKIPESRHLCVAPKKNHHSSYYIDYGTSWNILARFLAKIFIYSAFENDSSDLVLDSLN
jgi:hypothetical protein